MKSQVIRVVSICSGVGDGCLSSAGTNIGVLGASLDRRLVF